MKICRRANKCCGKVQEQKKNCSILEIKGVGAVFCLCRKEEKEMGIMRIALCDDEISLAQSYAGRIREWALRTGHSCEISILCSPKELLFESQDGCFYDLLLLDIEMPGMNGLELARAIWQTDRKVMIVFLTNFENFVFQGYEVGAFRYLMKAEVPRKLDALMDAAAAEWEEEKEYLLLRAGGGEERLELTELLYLEASRHDTILHTLTGERLLKYPISGLAARLPAGASS